MAYMVMAYTVMALHSYGLHSSGMRSVACLGLAKCSTGPRRHRHISAERRSFFFNPSAHADGGTPTTRANPKVPKGCASPRRFFPTPPTGLDLSPSRGMPSACAERSSKNRSALRLGRWRRRCASCRSARARRTAGRNRAPWSCLRNIVMALYGYGPIYNYGLIYNYGHIYSYGPIYSYGRSARARRTAGRNRAPCSCLRPRRI